MSQSTKQVRVVSRATPTAGQALEPTAFFDAAGVPIAFGASAAEDVSVEADEGIVGDNVQAVLADLASRVAALEAL